MQKDSINRFTVRADNYDKYRPGYPPELFDYLSAAAGLDPQDAIVDIGAGTGIFTAELVKWGNPVFAVEPNPQMRQRAEERLLNFPNAMLIGGTAEKTTLPDHVIQLLTCAQAFHWFDLDNCKIEFSRIAKPGAKAAIVWNRRNAENEFEKMYEQLIMHYATDYLTVTQHRISDQDMVRFFEPWIPEYRVFEHIDHLDFTQLRGRTLSYSFIPEEINESSKEMQIELRHLFDKHQEQGHVTLSYKTRLFFGSIAG